MDFGHTRDFSEFCEQLNEIRLKFYKWDSCEKTVALYYLMVGLPFANAKFLQNALEQCVSTINTPEAQNLERQANDPEVIASFLHEKPQMALCLILKHLPMLRPGNKKAAHSYLKTIRKVLTEFIQPPFKKIYNECVEIMSYVYIHPAFDKEDKKSFKHLLKQVLNKVSPDNFVHSPVNESSDESASPNPESFDKKRSNSLTPCGATNIVDIEDYSSQENLIKMPHPKPRSFSLSNEKNNTLSLNSLQSSCSETHLQETRIINNPPAMKSILSWLKSLRLHKYSWIFENLTYREILSMHEEYLSSVGVTKGARHKLILSLDKLRERSKTLMELETEIMNGGDITSALKKLKAILQSPLQVSIGEDLPSLFVKVMGKVCTQLLMLRQPTDENLVLFNSLCEKADSMDTFTDDQKKRLNMWKEQLISGNSIPTYTQIHQKTFRSDKNKYPIPFLRNAESVYTQKSSSYPNMQNNLTLNSHRHSVDSGTLQSQLRLVRQPVVERPKVNVTTASGVVRPSVSQSNRNSLEIESSLESLCLQMMEHALGP